MPKLFSRAHPSFAELLIVESGPRSVVEQLLPHFYEVQKCRQIDVLTCYTGAPETFDHARGQVFSIHDPALAQNRQRLLRRLSATRYSVVAILCTGSSTMERWKWILVLRTRAKVLIINEHAGYFFLDYWHRRTLLLLLSQRLNLGRELNLRLLGEILFAPFIIGFLAVYALAVHSRRLFNTRFHSS